MMNTNTEGDWGMVANHVTSLETIMLDIHQVAKMLTVSPKTVERMLLRGEFFAPVRFGRERRWSKAAVQKWVADQQPATA
jgi:excisionase family DNA binding protein